MDQIEQNQEPRDRRPAPDDSFWVEEGRLLAGPYPGSQNREEAEAKISALLDVGVDSFVDLTEECETGPGGDPVVPYDGLMYEIARERGIPARYLRMPITDLGVPQQWHMEAMLDLIEVCTRDGGIVYVHCMGGVGRTGTVLGCRMIEAGTPPSEVLNVIAEKRAVKLRSDRLSPETDEQREFVINWKRTSTPVPGRS